MTRLCPTDRYILLRGGLPVFTTSDLQDLVPWLWGRQLRRNYVVLDYERPFPVDNPDLLEWIKALEAVS